ncbi:MAG: peptidoglycan editing factor PgeF [Cardiobacteriaceae bacterium]|nr:peptidoglycan editing factor PgeF [Cardiobacteriaceae bacterium]
MQQVLWKKAEFAVKIPVIAGTTLSSYPDFARGFNLAKHIEDDAEKVEQARLRLMQATGLNRRFLWLNQIHSAEVITADKYFDGVSADAAISRDKNTVAVVMTADCVPILLARRDGQEVAAIHAGWRGIYGEIIPRTVEKLQGEMADFYAYIGPCAGRDKYEVDTEFRTRFCEMNAEFARFFRPSEREKHYLADLVAIVKYQLNAGGISDERITGGEICSISDERFFSYRRDGKKAGRTATFVACNG